MYLAPKPNPSSSASTIVWTVCVCPDGVRVDIEINVKHADGVWELHTPPNKFNYSILFGQANTSSTTTSHRRILYRLDTSKAQDYSIRPPLESVDAFIRV